MESKGFSIREAINFGWSKMRENLGFFIIFLVISWLVSMFFGGFAGLFEERLPIFSFLFYLANYLVSFVISLVSIRIGLKIYDGAGLSASDLLHFSMPLFLRFAVANILFLLLVAAGLLLFIVPGLIWMIKYQYVPYLIVDRDAAIGEAFSESGRITSGVKWTLFQFAIVLGLINIAGLLFFVIGLFATIPTTVVAMAYVYRKLSSGGAGFVNRPGRDIDPFTAPGITR